MTRDQPLFSIICTVKNRAALGRQCVESALAQDDPDVEFVVQDGRPRMERSPSCRSMETASAWYRSPTPAPTTACSARCGGHGANTLLVPFRFEMGGSRIIYYTPSEPDWVGAMTSISARIAEELGIRVSQTDAAIALLDDKATVPFIARYRKEATGGLDDTQLRTLEERLNYLRELEDRRAAICKSIEEQGKLTPELAAAIAAAEHEGAARGSVSALQAEAPHQGADRARSRPRAARAGAAARSDARARNAAARRYVERRERRRRRRRRARGRALDPDRHVRRGCGAGRRPAATAVGPRRMASTVVAGQGGGGREVLRLLQRHRAGEAHAVASRAGAAARPPRRHPAARGRAAASRTRRPARPNPSGASPARAGIVDRGRPADAWLAETVRWTWKVKLLPQLESEIEQRLRDEAEAEAIRVFGRNLHDLLLAAPAGQRVTMGLDPGIRTGVKVAVVDGTGKLLDTADDLSARAAQGLGRRAAHAGALCAKHGVELISIGNGTASRETDKLVADLMARHPDLRLTRVVVSEAGASVYSASELAAQEFPDARRVAARRGLDRAAAPGSARRARAHRAQGDRRRPVSARRQPGAAGAEARRGRRGLRQRGRRRRQHRVGAAAGAHLRASASRSPKNIVGFRDEHGPFRNRRQLLKVPRVGDRTFQQAAGFLRIMNGDNPLDRRPCIRRPTRSSSGSSRRPASPSSS